MSLFAADGCVNPNRNDPTFEILITADCEHVKVQSAVILLTAESPEAAARFVTDWLNIPRTHVAHVRLADM